ncbi:Uncharacterised protein [Pseudomonas aeruginosa]|nr:Uncharacterised protein [Pseudomonas aeruginosa]
MPVRGRGARMPSNGAPFLSLWAGCTRLGRTRRADPANRRRAVIRALARAFASSPSFVTTRSPAWHACFTTRCTMLAANAARIIGNSLAGWPTPLKSNCCNAGVKPTCCLHRAGITFTPVRRRAGHRAPDPLRHHPAQHSRGGVGAHRGRLHPARPGAEPVPRRPLPRTAHPQGRGDSCRAGPGQRPVPTGDAGTGPAGQRLRAHCRGRPGPRRQRQLLRAGGQPAHAQRCFLHAGKPAR